MHLKNLFVGFFLVLFFIFFSGVGNNVKAQEKSESSKVEAANQSFYKAFNNESLKEMDEVWSHSSYVRAIQPISKDIFTGWKAVRGSWEGVFKALTNIKISASGQVIHVDGNVAWVSNYEEFQAQQGDKTVKLSATATNMFVKKDGKWKMVFHQATVPVKM